MQLQPGTSVNLFYGANGAGKTSIIEALVVLAKGRSFRSGNISSLIGPESSAFTLHSQLRTADGTEHRVGLRREPQAWTGRVDGADLKQLSDAAKYFPLVLVEPTSHLLISGGPELRRRFLDWGVFHVKHEFLGTWRRYSRAVKQRNAALRSGDVSLVKAIDPELIRSGIAVHMARVEVTETLFPRARSCIGALNAQLADLEIRYQSGWRTEELAEALEASLSKDLERGFTSVGPHRADIQLRLGQRVVRDRLSRGEQKLLATALLLAQAEFLHGEEQAPVFLLDDLASEFDQQHLQVVTERALSLGAQLFVTGTEAKPYAFIDPSQCTLFHVKQGQIEAP